MGDSPANWRPLFEKLEPPKAEPEVLPLATDGDSLDYLQSIYRDPMQPTGARMHAAIAALPFERPKLAVAHLDGASLAAQLEDRIARNIERSRNVIESGEHQPALSDM